MNNPEWKLVPVEPTDEMEVAAENDYEQTGATFPRWKSAYAAMLNAAPPAPTSHPIPTGATGDAKEWGTAFDAWFIKRGVWPRVNYEEIFAAGWNARPAPAAGDALDSKPDWISCGSRRPWVTNSLKASAQKLRDKERRCRTAYNKDFYGIPARYVADAYAEAAAVFESKLTAIAQQKGEA